ncbi:hypothetical protein DFH28DRAFT_910843, partial [Melampsora americana]
LVGFYTFGTLHQIGDVALLNFPNLRVFKTHFISEGNKSEIYWLHLPIMKNVRTIVTDFQWIELNSQKASRFTFLNAVKEAPNLKHVVLTRNGKTFESQAINPTLIAAFQSHGVECHVTHYLTAGEIMELDYKLNGTMT